MNLADGDDWDWLVFSSPPSRTLSQLEIYPLLRPQGRAMRTASLERGASARGFPGS